MTVDEASADDLVQDVLVAVLASPPQERPSSVRAWLKTVLRRRASRSRRRRDTAERAERKAGRPEATSFPLAQEERLQLHEELARALRELAPDDQHLITRRYFDEVPPKVLAAELGISAATARQRVCRALARLRDRLARSERGAAGWSLALVALAELPAPPPPVPFSKASSFPAPAWCLIFMKTSNLLIPAAATILAALLAALATSVDQGTEGEAGTVVERGALEAPAPLVDLQLTTGGRMDLPTSLGPEAAAIPASAAGSMLRIIGPDGPVAHARAAWVDGARTARPIEVAVDGTAPRPDAESFRLFIAAPGHLDHHVAIETAGDCTVELEPARILRGVVTLDGRHPGKRIQLRMTGFDEPSDRGVAPWEWGLADRLRELGVIVPPSDLVVADEQGRFRVELSADQEKLTVWIPSGHYLAGDAPGARLLRDAADIIIGPETWVEEVRLDLKTVPQVTGRYVWDDDGSPLRGSAKFRRVNAQGRTLDGVRWTPLHPDGRFTVGVDERINHSAAREVGGLDPDASEAALQQFLLGDRATAIRISANGVPQSDRSIEVRCQSFPIDVGDIRVPRPATASLRVLALADGDWRPVRAIVCAPNYVSAATDAQGHVSIEARPGDPLDVLAAHHELVRVRVPEDPSSTPLEVLLEPAPTLKIRYPVAWTHVPYRLQPAVRLKFDGSPYGGPSGSNGDAPEYKNAHHYGLYGFPQEGVGMHEPNSGTTFALDRLGVTEVHGLRRGATFEVTLHDCFSRPIFSETITFDGETTIDVEPRQSEVAYLSCLVSGPNGAVVDGGRICLHDLGWEYWHEFEGDSVTLGPVAPGSCTLSLESEEFGRVDEEEFILHPGKNPHSVEIGVEGD
jgi:RNA polymerase sigma-70 factor (ECF subfamily)